MNSKENLRAQKMNKASCMTLGSMALAVIATTSANAQSACSEYTVISGDTLSQIANRANVQGGFRYLFTANSDILPNPNLLEVGQVLKIPCDDGTLPNSSNRSVTQAVPAPAPTTSSPDRPLRIVTGSGYAPFTDENMANGGALFEMVKLAVERGNPDQEYNLTFVNDWGAHLDSLLPSGAVDMSFPWFRPDCTKVELLSEASAYRCSEFNHSDPLYEALVGYYTLEDGEFSSAQSYADIMKATLCRPEAWFTFDLEAAQLMPPNVELVRPVDQAGCWQLLLDGKVDIVTLDALPAEEDYRELGLEGQILHLESLTSKQTMHVFVHKTNAFANEALPIINAGLEELRLSGEWFEIVREGILETVAN